MYLRRLLHTVWFAILTMITSPIPGQAQQANLPAPSSPVATASDLRPNYVLGPDDQITIRAMNVEEMNDKQYRVDSEGMINLPLVGKLKVSGMTVAQLESLVVERLAAFVRTPQVTITISQYRFEPIFAIGSFRSPGIYPLQGRRTLIEVLAQIGGLLPNASRRIRLIRRLESGPIPLPDAIEDRANEVSVVVINLANLTQNVNNAESIELKPFDVLKATPAGQVFVSGEVSRVGAVELNERDAMGVVEAVALSGGLTKDAKPHEAVILRPILESSRRAAIPVNLREVLSGQTNDYPLLPNDVLFVPRGGNPFRSTWQVVAPSAISAVITALIFAGR